MITKGGPSLVYKFQFIISKSKITINKLKIEQTKNVRKTCGFIFPRSVHEIGS